MEQVNVTYDITQPMLGPSCTRERVAGTDYTIESVEGGPVFLWKGKRVVDKFADVEEARKCVGANHE